VKTNDIIRPFETSLFVQFGSTGESRNVNTVRLDQGVTFSRDGNAIEARYHDGAGAAFVVERFSSDTLADNAFQQLQAAVTRYAGRRRATSFLKGVVKWVVAPFGFVVLALAVNMAATRGVVGDAPSLAASGAGAMVPLPANLAVQQPSAAPARPMVASPAELAKAMADGAKSGKYTVQLSKGSKGTLYVFSDPLCSHCQEFEPEIEKLAKDYTVYVFPVSVIGAEASQRRTARVLCAKADARTALWKKSVDVDEPKGDLCADGAASVAANDQFFRVMRFAGTPTVINAAGEQLPDSVPLSAQAVHQWMANAVVAQK